MKEGTIITSQENILTQTFVEMRDRLKRPSYSLPKDVATIIERIGIDTDQSKWDFAPNGCAAFNAIQKKDSSGVKQQIFFPDIDRELRKSTVRSMTLKHNALYVLRRMFPNTKPECGSKAECLIIPMSQDTSDDAFDSAQADWSGSKIYVIAEHGMNQLPLYDNYFSYDIMSSTNHIGLVINNDTISKIICKDELGEFEIQAQYFSKLQEGNSTMWERVSRLCQRLDSDKLLYQLTKSHTCIAQQYGKNMLETDALHPEKLIKYTQ